MDKETKKVLRFFKKSILNEEEYWTTVHEFELNEFKFLPIKGIQMDFKDNIRIPNEEEYNEVEYMEISGTETERLIEFETMVNKSWIEDERVYKNNETIHLNIDRDIFDTKIKLNQIDFGPKRSGYKFTVKIDSLDLQAKEKIKN